MKNFIVAIEDEGRILCKFTVYAIKRNTPVFIDCGQFSHNSNKGILSETLDILFQNKMITKKQYDDGYYNWSKAEKLNFKISEV